MSALRQGEQIGVSFIQLGRWFRVLPPSLQKRRNPRKCQVLSATGQARIGYHASHELCARGPGTASSLVAEYAEMDFDEIHLHQVGRRQLSFIEAFGEHVLPALKANV